jgi:YD repeat-containing protein
VNVPYQPKSGSTYAIVYNFGGISEGLLQKRQKQLDIYKSQGLPDTSEAVRGETLNIMGVTWLKEVAMAGKILSALTDTVFYMHHNVGLMAQESGYSIDVKAGWSSITSKHSNSDGFWSQFKAFSLLSSAFEHGMLEQLMGSDKPGVSTIKLLQIANATTGNKVFYANSTNYNSIQLKSYSDSAKAAIQSSINSGHTLILPEYGNLALNQWTGDGYIDNNFTVSPYSMGMKIGGSYGGYNSYQGDINSVIVNLATTANVTNISAPQTIAQTVSLTPPSAANEPVDMASGAFLYDRTDLSLGGNAPLGLAFTRSYTSNKNFSRRTMGYGFTHNYDIYITPTSHGEPVLGYRLPVETAGMIAAYYVILDLLKTQDTIQSWMAASLSSKWAIDQAINNAITVNLGPKVMEFIKLPDGTYSSPPGITTQLIKNTDSTYSLLERFGTRMDFNGSNNQNGANQISKLKDVDGNTMDFTYSGSNLIQVKDAFNRILSINYSSSGIIQNVADSASRSVSYGYDGSGNLISYKDPEGQEGRVWTYDYDSNHRLTTLANPSPFNTTPTVTNTYDSLGRVKTQAVPRQSGSATYYYYFSGFRNQEVDPAGNAQTYYYDSKC